MGNKMVRIPDQHLKDDALKFSETLLNMLVQLKANPSKIATVEQQIVTVSEKNSSISTQQEEAIPTFLARVSQTFQGDAPQGTLFQKVLSTLSEKGILERLHYFTQDQGKKQLVHQDSEGKEDKKQSLWEEPEDGFFLIVNQKCFIQSNTTLNSRKSEAVELLAQRLRQTNEDELQPSKQQFFKLLKGNLHLIQEKNPKTQLPLLFELCSSQHFRPDILEDLISKYNIKLSITGHQGNTILHQLCQTELIDSLSQKRELTYTKEKDWKIQNDFGETPFDMLLLFHDRANEIKARWNQDPKKRNELEIN